MTEEKILSKIKEIIVTQIGEDENSITPQSNIKDDLSADSLDLFELINEIEAEFDIKIESENGIETVQDLMDLVKKQLIVKESYK